MYSATGGGAGRLRSTRRQTPSAAPRTTATVPALSNRFCPRAARREPGRPSLTREGDASGRGLAGAGRPALDREPHPVAGLVVLDAVDELPHEEDPATPRHQHAGGMGGVADLSRVEPGSQVGDLD